MAKQVMERKAADNKYLHRDFHVSLDLGITYLGEHFGVDAIDAYLKQYAHAFYKKMSLAQLQQYFLDLYTAEEAPELLQTNLTDTSLTIQISECPAIRYMHSIGHEISPWYEKTTSVLYEELAAICGFGFELNEYDKDTGRACFVFRRVEK